MTMTYEVEKFGRGGDGKWFGFGARRFRDRAAAETYFRSIAEEQSAVLSGGIRIDMRRRAGRVLVMTVGGLNDGARNREIRTIAHDEA